LSEVRVCAESSTFSPLGPNYDSSVGVGDVYPPCLHSSVLITKWQVVWRGRSN